jgi:uncharacterized protein
VNLPCYPFLHRAFLGALERSGAVHPDRGWQPMPVQGKDFFMPLYLKHHNRGEYVFDHAWAHAYERHGMAYYPKLVTAIPFSPVTGPRWQGMVDGRWLQGQIEQHLQAHQASSWHLLFPDTLTRQALQGWPLAERHGCHFRWFNRGYAEFGDFLGSLTSRRRKSIRQERARIAGAGLQVEVATGTDIPSAWWPIFYQCYAATYYKRGQMPYLNEAFFVELADSVIGPQLMMVMSHDAQGPVAAALYLFDQHTLYGRYWGALRDYDALHFELCYYRGIEFCIERRLQAFDPGVQGEHKILRGFEPVITYSLHWMREPGFHQAVTDFCQREAMAVAAYQREARSLLPFRQEAER